VPVPAAPAPTIPTGRQWRHVVQCLEDRDELVAAGKPSVGGVALQEGHPVLDPAAEEVLARSIEARSESIPSTRTFAYTRAFSMLERPCPQA
jgi:hypothetical protein